MKKLRYWWLRHTTTWVRSRSGLFFIARADPCFSRLLYWLLSFETCAHHSHENQYLICIRMKLKLTVEIKFFENLLCRSHFSVAWLNHTHSTVHFSPIDALNLFFFLMSPFTFYGNNSGIERNVLSLCPSKKPLTSKSHWWNSINCLKFCTFQNEMIITKRFNVSTQLNSRIIHKTTYQLE